MIEAQAGKFEKTIITIEGARACIWTSCPTTARRLDRLCEEYPAAYRLTKIHRYGYGVSRGKIQAKEYEVRASHVRFVESEEAA